MCALRQTSTGVSAVQRPLLPAAMSRGTFGCGLRPLLECAVLVVSDQLHLFLVSYCHVLLRTTCVLRGM